MDICWLNGISEAGKNKRRKGGGREGRGKEGKKEWKGRKEGRGRGEYYFQLLWAVSICEALSCFWGKKKKIRNSFSVRQSWSSRLLQSWIPESFVMFQTPHEPTNCKIYPQTRHKARGNRWGILCAEGSRIRSVHTFLSHWRTPWSYELGTLHRKNAVVHRVWI